MAITLWSGTIFTRWLATQAESLGVEIFPGFTASEVIIENNILKGVVTGEMGVAQRWVP